MTAITRGPFTRFAAMLTLAAVAATTFGVTSSAAAATSAPGYSATTTIPIGESYDGGDIVVDDASSRAYVLSRGVENWDNRTLTAIDTTSDTVASTLIIPGAYGDQLELDAEHDRIIAWTPGDTLVAVVRASSLELLYSVYLDEGPRSVGIDTVTGQVLIGTSAGVAVLTPTDVRAESRFIALSGPADAIAVDEAGRRAYVHVERGATDAVATIDLDRSTDSVIDTHDLALAARSMQWDSGARRILLHDPTDRRIVVVDPADWSVGASIAVSENARDLAVDPIGRRAFVSNGVDSTVSVIDLRSAAVIGTLDGSGAAAIAAGVSIAGQKVYVARASADGPTSVLVFDGPAFIVSGGHAVLDVPADSAFYTEIAWMFSRGLTTGYAESDGSLSYRPTATVSREAMSAFLYRYSGDTFTPPPTPSFADVPVDSTFYTQIEWMKAEGISTGTVQADGSVRFLPGDPVSRQAMSAFLARLDGATPTAPVTSSFSDVPTDHPFFTEIEWMAAEGISTGYPDGTFRPTDVVTRQAMAAFLYRFDQRDD
ncbi:S-layer homology domain-containing protein [Microbacteriaceae bacterium VKM Ac-2855]|nr:S-layer homology domain-containing protein [Microbacteriaceae bacterium VKM Ac-2855]